MLLHADLSPSVQVALSSALPRLGEDASHTLLRLAIQRDLVTPQRIPCHPRIAWRPIPYDDAADVAGRFTAASRASTLSVAAMRDLLPQPTRGRGRTAGTLALPPALARERGLSR